MEKKGLFVDVRCAVCRQYLGSVPMARADKPFICSPACERIFKERQRRKGYEAKRGP